MVSPFRSVSSFALNAYIQHHPDQANQVIGYVDHLGQAQWVRLTPAQVRQQQQLTERITQARAQLAQAEAALEAWRLQRYAQHYHRTIVAPAARSPKKRLALHAQEWTRQLKALSTLDDAADRARSQWSTIFAVRPSSIVWQDIAWVGTLPQSTRYVLTAAVFWSWTLNHAGTWDGFTGTDDYQALQHHAEHTMETALPPVIQHVQATWATASQAQVTHRLEIYPGDKGMDAQATITLTWDHADDPAVCARITAFLETLTKTITR